MISKKAFCLIIKALEKQDRLDAKTAKAIDLIGDDEMNNPFVFTTPLISELISALKLDLCDWNDTISYWIWGCDYGREYDLYGVFDKNHNKIPMKTAGELYDYLTKERN